MHYEGEMLLTALLHLQSLLRRVSLDRQSTCPVNHAVDEASRPPVQAHTLTLDKALDGVAQHIVFRQHHLDTCTLLSWLV
ncbi:MAG: hypothetical protein M3410_05125 [Acidobacteriota bacterium]|nr:hypothetical protein [Acidobacteriota bacterium]